VFWIQAKLDRFGLPQGTLNFVLQFLTSPKLGMDFRLVIIRLGSTRVRSCNVQSQNPYQKCTHGTWAAKLGRDCPVSLHGDRFTRSSCLETSMRTLQFSTVGLCQVENGYIRRRGLDAFWEFGPDILGDHSYLKPDPALIQIPKVGVTASSDGCTIRTTI
jgi:hypothetical protein